MTRFWSSLAALTLLSSTAAAGPVADFETTYRAMYGTYRVALFKTNSGAQDDAGKAIAGLGHQLTALAETYGATPPPQYEDDPMWAETIDGALALVGTAETQIAAKDLTHAHETLEGVRDLFGALHARNGIETFSDRMNAYHAEMEHLLAMDLATLTPEGIDAVLEKAAVLSYLAEDVLSHPPLEAAGNAEYDALSAAFGASVNTLLAACRAGDVDQIRAAAGKVKAPYSKLFLKFG
ncbi:hypothetical protein [Celeribacter neptunius]|uniref:Imelysin n=1 Tax=Celeribacter neptunius TaxID=588602 RepID=A0A1I3UAK4_9RHOB|nr:hypothetical protein [Celeribacter neptunius]SFJ80578.1 hypothetical protein SAMN04487991_2985 [Celeribacter neptunius]